MRVGNFRAIAGSGGLAHFGRQSEEVFRMYGERPEADLRALARQALVDGKRQA